MKYFSCLVALACLAHNLSAQDVYTIKADSVKLTGCDSSELIIENHTQGVKGFLYNTGNGRTVFKKGLIKLSDSLYLIGGDTLKYNAWVQGGNKFGTTGVLGTQDDNHLDLYTNGVQRMRLTNTGRLLLQTTTDNGNLLQVNGTSSFANDMNIGSATITHDGRLIATNAILFNHFIPRYHNNSLSSPYVGRLEDVLYNYNTRLNTTTTTAGDGTVTVDIAFPADEAPHGITYPQGRLFFSFWSAAYPQTISVMIKDYSNNWHGPYVSNTNMNPGGAGMFMVSVPGFNYLTEIQAIMTPITGRVIGLTNIEYVLDVDEEGLTNPHPYVSKYGDEHIYNYFYLKNGGVDNVRLSPSLTSANYFMNNVLVGSTSDNGNAKLQVTGNSTITGNLGIGTTTPAVQLHTTGGVRFAGLTNDSTKTRVVVSDANGNLYYRSASSLAMNDILRSSLAVNGPVKARSLTLSQTGWPDYVFDSTYRLMTLKEVEGYIRANSHLPGIPSAASVEKEGVSVGDVQAALLKKIEELTLYNISLEKKIESQDKKLELLQQQMDQLLKKSK